MRMIRELFLRKKKEVQELNKQSLPQTVDNAKEEELKKQFFQDLENSEYIPEYKNNYAVRYDFNPEGEYIQTEQGIAIATIKQDEISK